MSSNEFQSKVVSATADRANVNFVQYSEVLLQLKEDQPWILKINCKKLEGRTEYEKCIFVSFA